MAYALERELPEYPPVERRYRPAPQRRRRRKKRSVLPLLLAGALLFADGFLLGRVVAPGGTGEAKTPPVSAEAAPAPTDGERDYAEKLRFIQSSGDYPAELAALAEKYPQVIDYVYHYPEEKDKPHVVDLSVEAAGGTVPLLMQWDERWGYVSYGSGLIGYTGCGPVSLSMAALYLTGDARWTPVKIAKFAVEKGYCVPGNGTSWTLISEGSQALGLCARELPLLESVMKRELDGGCPIIVVVGPGDFTGSGHYMVVTGYDETGFTLNDPNSRENSERTWTYDVLSPQIRNLWSVSKA